MQLATELKPVSLIGFADGAEGSRIYRDEPGNRLRVRAKILLRNRRRSRTRRQCWRKAPFPSTAIYPAKTKEPSFAASPKAIEAAAPAIIQRANLETALPEARLQGEVGRTCNQLRLFAELVEEGSWVDARIDSADPNRKPLPKPSIRSMHKPLGPSPFSEPVISP